MKIGANQSACLPFFWHFLEVKVKIGMKGNLRGLLEEER